MGCGSGEEMCCCSCVVGEVVEVGVDEGSLGE